ncbi:MAG: hypothetical protein AAGC68_01060 [Verrucomicrobiota bacterium]
MKTSLSLLTALLLFTACSDGPPEEAFVPPPIGVLDTGDYLVTLHATPENPAYSVEDKEGNTLARNLSRDDFEAQFPDLFQDISTIWAGNRRGELEADPMSLQIIEDLELRARVLPNSR